MGNCVMVAMSFYKEDKEEFSWDEKDFYVEVKQSNLRRARNAHLSIGFAGGIAATLTAQLIWLWVLGIV